MDQRILGRTGVSVSKMRLGAMMLDAWGNPDRPESIRIIHAALDRIDEIVLPGITINPVDNSFENLALSPTARRR